MRKSAYQCLRFSDLNGRPNVKANLSLEGASLDPKLPTPRFSQLQKIWKTTIRGFTRINNNLCHGHESIDSGRISLFMDSLLRCIFLLYNSNHSWDSLSICTHIQEILSLVYPGRSCINLLCFQRECTEIASIY